MIYLESCRFINCQSIPDETYNFSTGLNVFVGPNSSGKSIFFKCVGITSDTDEKYRGSKENRRDFIRLNQTSAQALFLFSDGSVGGFRMYESGTIFLYNPDLNKSKDFRTSKVPFQEVIDRLGLIVDPTSGFIPNMLDLDKSLLFVNSETKANHNLVHLLTYHETLDKLIEQTSVKITEYSHNLSKLDIFIPNLEGQLNSLQTVNIDKLANNKNNLDFGIAIYEPLLEVGRLLNQMEVGNIDNRDFDFMLDLSGKVESLMKLDLQLTWDDTDYSEFLTLVEVADKSVQSLVPLVEFVPVQAEPLSEVALQIFTLADQVDRLEFLPDYREEVVIGEHFAELLDLNVNSVFWAAPVPSVENEQSVLSSLLELQGMLGELSNMQGSLWDVVPDVSEELALFGSLLETFVAVKNVGMLLETVKEASQEVSDISEELFSQGKTVPCVIYGEVQHIDGHCIPRNF